MKQQTREIGLLKRILTAALILALSLSAAACAAPASSNATTTADTQSAAPGTDEKEATGAPAGTGDASAGSPASGEPPWRGRENERITIRAGFAKGMTGIANHFAIEKGWYDEAGFDLELIDIPNPVSAFGAGEVDIADGDPGTYIPAIVNGVPIKIVSNMWRNRGAYWIIAKPEIKTWEDLKGKVVGSAQATGGMRLTLMEVLTQNGIDPEKDVELVANNFYQAAYATLVSGEVDATIIHQPFATISEKEGEGHVLAKTWEFLPDYHTGVLVASQKLIDERPDVVERLLEVYFYANEYAKTHLDEFFPWAGKYLNIDEEIAREAINAEIVLWENDPIVDTSRLQVTEDLLAKYGMQRESLPVEGTVDNTFAEKVAQTLKLGKYAADK